MSKLNWRATRISLWWGIVVTCATTLLFTSPLPERAVVAASIVLCVALIVAVLEHGLFRAPVAIGTVPRVLLILIMICSIIGLLAWYAWPPRSVVYIKPGGWLNPNSTNATWMFAVVVRGSQPVYNVTVIVDDVQKDELIRSNLNAAKSDVERNRIASEMLPLTLHYPELDPSTTSETDREVDTLLIPTGLQRKMKYEIVISFRGVDERETLEINSPEDHIDWQYKMKVVSKQTVAIDCQDPRFPFESTGEGKLPQCFPEYGGRLPH
jgi:hypothetical protein